MTPVARMSEATCGITSTALLVPACRYAHAGYATIAPAKRRLT